MKKIISLSILLSFGLMLVLVSPAKAVVECREGYDCKADESTCDTDCSEFYAGYGAKCDSDNPDDEKFCCRCFTSTACDAECEKIDSGRGLVYGNCMVECEKSPIVGKEDIEVVLNTVVNWFSIIVGTIAILMLIIGAVMYMTAAGDEDKLGKAKNVVKFAIIGLVIALIAWGVKTIILSFMP